METHNVVPLNFWNKSNNISDLTSENSSYINDVLNAQNSKTNYRFKYHQWWEELEVTIALSMKEIENSELALSEIAKEEHLKRNPSFDSSIDFRESGMKWEKWYIETDPNNLLIERNPNENVNNWKIYYM